MPDTAVRPLALVTGASSGIGLELAKQFAENGYDLIVAAEDTALEAAALQLRQRGAAVSPVRADLARREEVEKLVAAVRGAGRPLDAAALNAGVGVGGRFVETDLEAELDLVALNCVSTMHLAKRVAQDMVVRGEGRILFTSSVASQAPQPFQAVYGASKAFVQSLALALREEVADTGVTVTAMLPGPTDTEFFDRGDLTDTKLGASDKKDDPAQVAEQGFRALMKGEATVFAGSLASRAMGRMSAMTPDTVAAKTMKPMTAPGSADG
ncbi:SDR family NAD(P)-dependent oxidoreductase [Blastococcus sp. VKM Ac-2987]|uniref:SDR family NAD(P)-dependent oxidoreductase n=1 Tax=Blastococcus sp. VKM Ac-2987 TaxID=3004141 RepID=UPI0022ABA875|nr:SDR family NAD(P)-dependent oxidoreductase [Blastococcus sp. VKM Ac-2987]MCZ2858737.1 SDR family NAD(P)-dependent oxidoreductase [Blastococcus sp. VKM Ac-2987]